MSSTTFKVSIVVSLFLLVGIQVTNALVADAQSRDFNLIGNKNFKFHLVNMNDATSTQLVINLPSTRGNDGMIQVFKAINPLGVAGSVLLQPVAEDEISDIGGGPGGAAGLAEGYDLMLVADAQNHVWWDIRTYSH